jgi:hypothetical protein
MLEYGKADLIYHETTITSYYTERMNLLLVYYPCLVFEDYGIADLVAA